MSGACPGFGAHATTGWPGSQRLSQSSRSRSPAVGPGDE